MIYLMDKNLFNMQKTFYNYLKGKRPITVVVTNSQISFHFKNENDRVFYRIPTYEWISDRTERQGREDNWHFHMMEKTWFCEKMKNFINDSTKEKIS